jgi:tight adherence protein B
MTRRGGQGRGWRSGGARRRPPPARGDLIAATVEVTAALRSGADPARAWADVLGTPPARGGAPQEAEVLAALRTGARASRRPDAGLVRSVAVVVAATRLAVVLGAPLSEVLDRCTAALEAEDETASEVEAALAGPRQTAQLLGWLPLVGLVLGLLLGADPLGVLLDGRWGTLAGTGGLVLTLLGRRWISRMIRAARTAGGL